MKFNFLSLKPKSISQKILAAIFVISSIVTLAITIFQLSFDYYQEINSLKKSLNLVEESYVKSIVSSLWELNEQQIQTQLDGITSIPGIEFVEIQYKGHTIAKSGSISENTINKSVDLIRYDKKLQSTYLGRLNIYASVDQVLVKIYNKIFIIFITQLFKTMLVSFFIYLSVQKLVTGHLIHISSFLENIDFSSLKNPLVLKRKTAAATGDAQGDAKDETKDELDILANSINQMREKLYKSYSELNTLNKELEDKVEIKTQIVLEQRQKLENSARMSSLGEMAGGIAHEINNPIMIIGTASQLLRRTLEAGITAPEKLATYFDKIDKTTDRITKIITGLLALTRDASNEDYTSFKIGDVLSDVLSLCAEKFKARGIDIQINLEDDIFQTVITGRRVQYSQVFLNLLHNSYDAIEHLPERWIKIEAKIQNDQLRLSFTDSGKGIPVEIQDKVMQPFFTTKEVGKGTGLGLSLSMAIIKNHNGEFFIDSQAENTCFIVGLPINGKK